MTKPNIVLIISDALRPKDMSLYGYKYETDRNIKKIASESTVFENNFSASNASDASVTALFSGKYPSTNGFIHQHPFMRESEIAKLKKNKFWLPVFLRNQGYSTISATPMNMWFKKGFDFYKEKEAKGSGKMLNTPFIKRILLRLPNWAYSLGKKLFRARASPEFYSCKEVIDVAISKISENEQTKKPFFVFMHLVDSHYPYTLAGKQNIKGERTLKKILSEIKSPSQREYIKKRFTDIHADSFEEIEKRRDISISIVDREIGRLYGFLKSKGLWENTLFVIMSDHGDNFGEHNTYFCRGGLYDSSIKTPLIIHVPKVPARRTNELTQNIDIAPTILSVIGESRKDIDGKSLINLMKTGKKIRNKAESFDGFCNDSSMERTKTKKTIRSDGGRCYLCGAAHNSRKEEYNLIEDPEELNNLSNS